jgi:hypothetical protein
VRTAAPFLVLLAAACAAGRPQSAQELRQAVAPSKWDRVEIARPHREVVANLQRNAPKCLNVVVKGVEYRSTLVSSARRAELHLERRDQAGNYYVFVADVVPSSKGTRMQLHFMNNGYDSLVRAVIGWSRGASHSCPDLGKGR